MVEGGNSSVARKHAVRQIAIRRACRARQALKRRHGLVSQPADGAAGEARQAWSGMIWPAGLGQLGDRTQRIVAIGVQRDGTLRPHADKRVASHMLAAFDRFEQKRRSQLAGRQQSERRNRRQRVGQQFDRDRVKAGAVLLGQCLKLLKRWCDHSSPKICHPHCLFHQRHRLGGDLRGTCIAGADDLLDVAWLRLVLGAALADRLEEIVERRCQLALDFDIADSACPVALFEIVDLGDVGIEGVVVDEDRVALDAAGNIGARTVRDR